MPYTKKSAILFELLVSIVILAILSTFTLKFIFTIYKQNIINHNLNLSKLDLESTKLFLLSKINKKINIATKLNNIQEDTIGKKLYYNQYLLLENVTKFDLKKNNNIFNIDICIKRKYEICSKWIIK